MRTLWVRECTLCVLMAHHVMVRVSKRQDQVSLWIKYFNSEPDPRKEDDFLWKLTQGKEAAEHLSHTDRKGRHSLPWTSLAGVCEQLPHTPISSVWSGFLSGNEEVTKHSPDEISLGIASDSHIPKEMEQMLMGNEGMKQSNFSTFTETQESWGWKGPLEVLGEYVGILETSFGVKWGK